MALAITVSLASTPDTVTFRALPPDIEAPVTVPGVIHRAAGGTLIHYQVGAAYFEVVIQAQHLTNAQKNSLESFFRTHWKDSITYTDEQARTFAGCKFLETTLPFVKEYRDSWRCAFKMQFPSILL